MSQKLFIIAGNYDQYKQWIWVKGVDTRNFVFVAAPDALRGIENPHGVFIGTWYERPDAYNIIEQLGVCSRKPNEALGKALVLLKQFQKAKFDSKIVGAT